MTDTGRVSITASENWPPRSFQGVVVAMTRSKRRRLANTLILPVIAIGAMALTMFAASAQKAHRVSTLPSSSAIGVAPSR